MTIILLLAIGPILLANLVFLVEMAAGLRRTRPQDDDAAVPRSVILVPAHNEEMGLAAALQELKTQASPDLQVLVVADNCTDQTAEVARQSGVAVVERSDSVRRGKGYALAFGRQQLRNAPPQAVIVLDADCRMDRSSLARLAIRAAATGRPCQAINLIEPSPDSSAMEQVSAFAFLIKNLFRQRGLQRLTGGVHLTGTGMCLPWAIFDQAPLETSSIVEDVRLGLEMRQQRAAPLLVADALVTSPHAARADTLAQRSRWEGGFLSLARVAAPRLVGAGLARFDLRLILAGLDFLVPPLALLALLNAIALAIAGLLVALGLVSWVPLAILAGLGTAMGIVLLVAWVLEGRRFLSAKALLRLPLYAVWKIPMYFAMARKGAPSEWQRTRRPGE